MLLLLMSMATGCVWEVPLDTGADPILNTISGTVVVDGVSRPGPAFVLLYAADDPPPPLGTGAPVNMAAVSPDDFSGGGDLQSGSYILTNVPDGEWLLTGLMDADDDFHPLLTAGSGATCGDVVGAHVVDIASGELAPVSVAGGTRLDDVTVALASEVTTERPGFTLTGDTVSRGGLSPFSIAATGIESEIITLDWYDDPEGCPAVFLFWAVDSDEDGLPDPHPEPALAAAGAYDLWPRVYLRYAGEEGRDVVSEAVLDPPPLGTGALPIGDIAPALSLDALFVGVAIETLADGSQVVLEGDDVPAGDWSVTVVNPTGQTWTLPNEVALYDALPGARDAFSPAAQGASLTVE